MDRIFKILLCLCFVLTTFQSSAQGYDKFLDNTSWLTGYSYHQPPLTPVWWHTTGDTSISGKSYKIIENNLPQFLHIPLKVFLREDTVNKQVFYLDTSFVEHLWYDFGLNIGDSTLDQYGNYKTVQSIDTIQTIWGVKRRLIFQTHPYSYPVLIEGVGWADGRNDFLRFHTSNFQGWSWHYTSCIYKNGIQAFRFDSNRVQLSIPCESMCPSVGTEDSLSDNYLTICPGDSAIVVGPCDTSVFWTEVNNPSVILSTSDTLTVKPTSTTAYVWQGSLKSDTVVVAIKKRTQVNLGNDTVSCLNEPVVLTPWVSDSVVTFLWSNDSTSSSINTTTSGKYWVSLQDLFNCFTSSDTINYTAIDPPLVTIEPFDTIDLNSGPYSLITGRPLGGTYFGNGVMSSTFDPLFVGPGSHKIYYTFEDSGIYGCSDTALKVITVQDYTSIDKKSTNKAVDFYPNPARNFLYFKNVNTSTTVHIYNSKFELIISRRISNSESEIDIHSLSKGFYFIQLMNENYFDWSKLIKL